MKLQKQKRSSSTLSAFNFTVVYPNRSTSLCASWVPTSSNGKLDRIRDINADIDRPYPAEGDVYVTGDFDDWGKTVKLDKVGDVFQKEVQLTDVDKDIAYKFVIDGDKWVHDVNAPTVQVNDYTTNNVLKPDNIHKTGALSARRPSAPRVLATSRSPPGSFSGGSQTAPTVSSGGEGAPLLTKEQSDANASRWVPHVTPNPNRSNILSQTDGASTSKEEDSHVPGGFPETPANEERAFGVSPLPASGHENTQSSITTSKEDYENAGGLGKADAGTASVAPLPATGHENTQSSVTTSKEAYENAGGEGNTGAETVSVNPLPATGHENTQSSVTTSKADYEKAGALGMAGAAVAGVGATLGSLFSKPKSDDKNIIPESSLPINTKELDTKDTGAFISSSGPGTTTADLASKVPLEPKRDAQVIEPGIADSDAAAFITSSGPGTTTADLASKVPLEQNKSVDAAPEVVAEKSAVEKELLAKVPTSQETGESASAAANQTSYHGLASTVPETVEQSMAKANAPPEAAADASIVAEKTALERELATKVPVVESAGEPAPTLSAATTSTAPTTSVSPSTNLTDGKTANEVVPGTDTTTQTSSTDAGEIAGGAIVGGSAAAGATALATKHNDPNVEPARVADSSKPAVTSEAAPATKTGAPIHNAITVDPKDTETKPSTTEKIKDAVTSDKSTTDPDTKPSTVEKAKEAVTPSKSSAPETPKKTTATPASAATTPARSTTDSTNTDKGSKRKRMSAFFKKVFD